MVLMTGTRIKCLYRNKTIRFEIFMTKSYKEWDYSKIKKTKLREC